MRPRSLGNVNPIQHGTAGLLDMAASGHVQVLVRYFRSLGQVLRGLIVQHPSCVMCHGAFSSHVVDKPAVIYAGTR